MSDNYKKQKTNKGESLVEALKDWRDSQDQNRRSQSVSRSKQKLCCGYFSIKTGFVLFGVFDFLWFLMLTTVAIYEAVKHNYHPSTEFYVFMLQLVPKLIGFIMVLVADSVMTRHVYKILLRIIMILMMFVLPVYYLIKIKTELIPLHCES